jgi:7-cyano-7-deazaguanine reductase
MQGTRDFKALGHKVVGTLQASDLETLPVRGSVSEVKFVTKELVAMCPVTQQPDIYTAEVEYIPKGLSVESKTLKLYLNSFRDVGIFGEDLATVICEDLYEALSPVYLKVTLIQNIRGGLEMTATAEQGL